LARAAQVALGFCARADPTSTARVAKKEIANILEAADTSGAHNRRRPTRIFAKRSSLRIFFLLGMFVTLT
jgi:hypothetical protein